MAMKEPMSKLPNTMSALLRLAVSDAQKCEADPSYVLEMAVWHQPTKRDGAAVCGVCLAGSVMAQSFGCSPKERAYLEEFGEEDSAKLDAVDDMRMGCFDNAVDNLGLTVSKDQRVAIDSAEALLDEAFGEDCSFTRLAPWSVYLKVADILERAGL